MFLDGEKNMSWCITGCVMAVFASEFWHVRWPGMAGRCEVTVEEDGTVPAFNHLLLQPIFACTRGIVSLKFRQSSPPFECCPCMLGCSVMYLANGSCSFSHKNCPNWRRGNVLARMWERVMQIRCTPSSVTLDPVSVFGGCKTLLKTSWMKMSDFISLFCCMSGFCSFSLYAECLIWPFAMRIVWKYRMLVFKRRWVKLSWQRASYDLPQGKQACHRRRPKWPCMLYTNSLNLSWLRRLKTDEVCLRFLFIHIALTASFSYCHFIYLSEFGLHSSVFCLFCLFVCFLLIPLFSFVLHVHMGLSHLPLCPSCSSSCVWYVCACLFSISWPGLLQDIGWWPAAGYAHMSVCAGQVLADLIPTLGCATGW